MLTGKRVQIFILLLFLLFIELNECLQSDESCENLKDTVNYDNCNVKLMSDEANFEILCHTNRTYKNKRWGENVRKILMTLKFRTTTKVTDSNRNVSSSCIRLMSINVKGPPPNKLDNRNLSDKAEDLEIHRAFFYPKVDQTYVDYSEINSFEFEFRFLSNLSVGAISCNQSCISDLITSRDIFYFAKCFSEVKAFEFNAHPIKIFQYPESTYVSHIFDFTNFDSMMRFNASLYSYAIHLFVFNVDKIGISILSGLKVRELSLASNNIERIGQGWITEIPSLKALHLNNVNLEFIMDNAFNSMPNLEHLNLAGNSLLANLTDVGVGLPNLKILVLAQCPKIPEIIFRYNFSRLNTLDLSENYLESGLNFTNIFEHFPNLETLNLDNNNIGQVLDFSPPINRDRTFGVSLRDNNIDSWNETKLNLSRNALLKLDLSNNNISIVSPKMLDEFSSIKNVILDNNPLDCRQCVVDPFVNWLQKRDGAAPYKCWFPEEARNKMIVDLKIDADLCTEKIFDWLINVYTPLIVFAGISIMVTALVIKYRWHLRYFYHLFHARMIARKRKFAVEDEPSHHFDAFVSYSSMDANWVVEQLIPHVEQEEPALHLCIHDRDFLAGGVIMENIVECIDISRKSIFLISKSFIRSNWCKWELQMAQHKLFDDGNDVLILILLEELNNNEIPKTLKRLMSTRTYLMWPDPLNVPACKLFWSRLKQAIGQCRCMKSQNQFILVNDE